MAGHHSVEEILSPLIPVEKEYLLISLLRLPDLFAAAHEKITVDHFDRMSESSYYLVWLAVKKLVEELGPGALFENPSKAHLLVHTKCMSLLQLEPRLLPPEAMFSLFDNSAKGFLYYVYALTTVEDLDPVFARNLTENFLRERAQSRLQRLLHDAHGQVLGDLPKILQDMTDQAVSATLGLDDPLAEPAPDSWSPKKLEIRPTGLSFLDNFMRGGPAPQEVYGIVGVTGVGKTTLAIQLAASGAEMEIVKSKQAKEAGQVYEPAWWFIFHYETGIDEMRRRLLVYAGQIDRNTLEDCDAFSKLSTAANPASLKDYELTLSAQVVKDLGPSKVDGELERLHKARERVNRNVRLIDMSCPPGAPRRGTGYIQEVAAVLRTANQRGIKIGGVVLDYAGLIAKRYCDSKGMESSSLRHLIGGMGDACYRMVAAPFNCSVFVFHQLTGEAAKFSPHRPPSHADAAEAKNFAENMWFAFTMGTRHEPSGCVLLHCSKSRRAGRDSGNTILVHLNGAMGRFTSDTGQWHYYDGEICSKVDTAKIAAATQQSSKIAAATQQSSNEDLDDDIDSHFIVDDYKVEDE
jgi:hypothetical protein